jgi:putative tricarboxylic transport membrane protein
MAVMLGVLMTHSITPGPGLFRDQPELVHGLFAALVIAHFFMLAIQLGAGNRIFLKIACVPPYLLVPVVLVMCAIGCYALNNQLFDVWLFLAFGIVGYMLDKADFPLAPIVIGLILGGLCEENLRQALSADPHVLTFFTRPISAAFLVLTVLSALFCARQSLKGRKGLKAMMSRTEDD